MLWGEKWLRGAIGSEDEAIESSRKEGGEVGGVELQSVEMQPADC